MNPRLSILIATTPDRRPMFMKLRGELERQSMAFGEVTGTTLGLHHDPSKPIAYSIFVGPVEIHWHEDNKELSIGAKRQAMIEAATGDYVAHFDSDDWPAPNYVSAILTALESDPDTVGMLIRVEGLAPKPQTGIGSMRFARWQNNKAGYDYVRPTYHKNPTRRSIALAVGFKDMRFGEDFDYSIRLKDSGLLKTERMVNEELYIYRYKYAPHGVKYGIK